MGNNCACCDSSEPSPTQSNVENVTAQAFDVSRTDLVSATTDEKIPATGESDKAAVKWDASTDASGAGSMVLTFRVPDTGNRVEVDFPYRPLGLNFSKRAPVRIKSVEEGSCGARGGVGEGWILLKINDDDVSDKEFDYIVARLKDEARQLRVEGKLPKKASKSRGSSRGNSRGSSACGTPRGTPRDLEACPLEAQLAQ